MPHLAILDLLILSIGYGLAVLVTAILGTVSAVLVAIVGSLNRADQEGDRDD